jgi:uncharacterized membrane protein
VNRYAVLYLATMIALLPLDLLFLGVLAKGLFASEVGDMLGGVRVAPAILFYLIYIAGIVVFVNGSAAATWPSTAFYGALFGLFCYATFELTSMAMLKHWSWTVVAVDMSWGVIVTAISATAGLLITNWLLPRG